MDKICPLMSMQTGFNSRAGGEASYPPQYVECEKENCAWWVIGMETKPDPDYLDGRTRKVPNFKDCCAIKRLAEK